MIKIYQILLLLCLVLFVRSQDQDTCQDTCYNNHCDGDGLSCIGPLFELEDTLLEFEDQECTDYLYTLANQDSTDDEIKTGFTACMGAHAAKYTGEDAYKGQYFGCITDCIIEYPENYFEDLNRDITEFQVCILECTETSDCNYNSDCYEENFSQGNILLEMTLKNDIDSCDQVDGRQGSPDLSDEEYNGLASQCYTDISNSVAAENNQNAGTHPDDLAEVLSCVAECIDDYGIDNEIKIEESEEEECEDQYCLYEFDNCLKTCQIECYDNDCLGNEYLSILESEECKTFMQDRIELQQSDEIPIVDQDYLDQFEDCIQTYEEQFSENQDILDLVQCYRECKVEPDSEIENSDDDSDDDDDDEDNKDGENENNENDDGENGSILTIGFALLLALIIV